MKNLTPTETVNQIGRLNLSGNVIPANWWHHIKIPSGKPDSTAIVLLSEIIYWYRPAEIRDESTGELKGWRKRFQGDKLQRSYQSFADQFGFTKREVTDALKRLNTQGIITLELRTINTSTGACSNVLFIEPVPARIDEITNSRQLVDNQPELKSVSVTPPTLKRNSSYVETEHLLRSNVIPPTLKRKTYTKNTTETTNIDPSIISLTKKSKVFDPSSVELPGWLLKSTWHSWLQYRKEINKPIKSQMTVDQTIKLLAKCCDSGYSPEDIINTSIANGWQGLFEPKETQSQKSRYRFKEIAKTDVFITDDF